MKYLGWIFAGLLILGQVAAGGFRQSRRTDVSWSELKNMQTAERNEFLQTQKDSFDKCLENQKLEVTNTSGISTSELPGLIEKLRTMKTEERKELMRTQSEEREKELETWTAERKAYFNGQ